MVHVTWYNATCNGRPSKEEVTLDDAGKADNEAVPGVGQEGSLRSQRFDLVGGVRHLRTGTW